MKKTTLVLLVLFFTIKTAHAQALLGQQLVDSLLNILPGITIDTDKVLVLAKLGKEYSSIDQNEALKRCNEALSLAKDIKWEKGIGISLQHMSRAYYKKDNFPASLECSKKALEIFERNNLRSKIPSSLIGIGNVYAEIGDYNKALVYYEQALAIYKELKDLSGESTIINNIAAAYLNRGEYRTALAQYRRSLYMKEELNDRFGIAMAYNNIGYAYLELKQYDSSLFYSNKSLEINKETNNKFRASENTQNMANAYMETGQYDKAIYYTYESIKYLEDVDNLTKQQENYALLAKLYQKKGNTAAALKAFQQYDILKDSVTARRNVQQINQLRLEGEFEKKQFADSIANAQAQQAADDKLQRQQLISIAGVGVAFILIILSFFVIRERKKSDKLLLNILPSEVAKELKQRGATTAQQFEHVTVIFTDFVGFTKAGERMTSQELVEELHNCFKTFDEIISRHGIEKIKTIGDAYLAVCGLPVKDNKNAKKVVEAAKEILSFMLQRRAQLGDKTFEIRIGIHSGEVVAGIVGVKKFAYDIWGDTVNTAARMEQNSEPGKINISESTYELVKNEFTCTYRGELEAKNKGKLKMYFVEV